MSTTTPFIAPTRPQLPSQQDEILETVDICIDRTASALLSTRAATEVEVSHAISALRYSQAEGVHIDLLQALAKVQGQTEEHMGTVIPRIAEKIGFTINPVPQLIPFAGKLIAPSAFYESYDRVHLMAKALMVPVIFVEDTDAIGVGSANPIAAAILADKIQEIVFRRFDIRPFMTVVRLDYETWTFLANKHFEL